jgi:hypothetical protein
MLPQDFSPAFIEPHDLSPAFAEPQDLSAMLPQDLSAAFSSTFFLRPKRPM